ncbi:hypothetical protein M0805_007705 [Coniferiporia weirii]|nr:hypothetical protein M0805_007705 [Coniferiporia weirii]
MTSCERWMQYYMFSAIAPGRPLELKSSGAFLPSVVKGFTLLTDTIPERFVCHYRLPIAVSPSSRKMTATTLEVRDDVDMLLASCSEYVASWIPSTIDGYRRQPYTEERWYPANTDDLNARISQAHTQSARFVAANGLRIAACHVKPRFSLASADLLTEFFALDKDSLSPLALDAQTFPKVVTILDASLTSSSATFAHTRTNSKLQYLSLKSTSTLKTETAASASPSKAAVQEKSVKEEAKIEGAVQIAIGVKADVDFPTWYTNVLIEADMLDHYSVSGCYILKPWSYGIWEAIQEWFNSKIKEMGVKNAYFPMFVSQKVAGKDHIEGFSPEVAWVTRAGNSDLDEPIVIRPTSETAIYLLDQKPS